VRGSASADRALALAVEGGSTSGSTDLEANDERRPYTRVARSTIDPGPSPMPLQLTPGNSLTCKINSHRQSWNGTICSDPENWNCGAASHFRTDYCASGDDRCFHVRAFDPVAPSIMLDGNGADWILGENPSALDDQLLFFWGQRTSGDRGIPDSYQDQRPILFGAYRVANVELIERPHRNQWKVQPYADGWADFSKLHIKRPRYEYAGGQYINQLDARDVDHALRSEALRKGWADDATVARFDAFRSGYPRWIALAAERAKTFVVPAPPPTPPTPTHRAAPLDVGSATTLPPTIGGHRPFRGLESVRTVTTTADAAPTGRADTATNAPDVRTTSSADDGGTGAAVRSRPVPTTSLESGARQWIASVHGERTCTDLEVALATRDLIIVQGEPGVGKSHLALRLLDDAERTRTLVVPVAATWRGREDLLGYVNPIDGSFVSTPFTRFLERAAEAWKSGDRATRLVVFEEFNLSQPEHWLADVLALSQYDDETDRSIHLCQTSDGSAREVFLSPALRFVGTVNNDHTTRSLSPRVLDRAAVVSLSITAKQAMQRVGLDGLDSDLAKAIADLDFLLSPRGAAFSIRTARALKQCLAIGEHLTPQQAVDIVLSQQVLSKVELFAHDPVDLALAEQLDEWRSDLGGALERCSETIGHWRERLASGRNVGAA
jgi:hypothetical protein